MSTFILPRHEHVTLGESHQPTFDHRFMIGSTIVGALIGPPHVGRSRLIRAMAEQYPDVTPFEEHSQVEADTQHELHLIGTVTDSEKWFAGVAQRMPPSARERHQLRDNTIAAMTWLLDANQQQLPIVYTSRKHETEAAARLYAHLTEGEPLPFQEDNRTLAQRLILAAETMGTEG